MAARLKRELGDKLPWKYKTAVPGMAARIKQELVDEEYFVKSYREDLSMNANQCDSMSQENIDTAEVKPPDSCFEQLEMYVQPRIMSGHAEEVNMQTKTDLLKAAWKIKTLKWEEKQVSEATIDCHSGQLNSKREQNMNNACLQNGDYIKLPDSEISILGYNNIASTSGVAGLVDNDCAEEEIYRCDVYDLGYNDNVGFTNDHTYFYTGQIPITCDFCDAKFSNVWFLKDHIIIHLDQKTKYKCDVCGKTFSYIHSLIKHKKIHSGIKPFKCDVCGSSFFKGRNLACHKRKVHRKNKPYSCPICDTSFSSLHCFNMHNRIHTEKILYTCDDCNRKFALPYQLKLHIQIHAGEKPYQCEDCGAAFSQKRGLKRHRNIHTGEEPYKCDICSKAFVQLSSLWMHKRIHTGEKPYTCDVCSKEFVQLSHLIRHKRIHTGEKPYTCDVCGASFTQKSHVETHTRTHTGETPYKCDACGAAFSRKISLTYHIRIHTGNSRVNNTHEHNTHADTQFPNQGLPTSTKFCTVNPNM